MEKMTFEQAIKRLEEIVDLLENNETSLDDSVELFQYCSKKLGNVENKVSKILIDGQLEDFDVEVENNE